MLTLRIARGRCLPLGASAQPDGVNFALLCRHGTAVFLVVYPLDGGEPIAEIALHPRRNRTGDHWHVLVAGLPPAFGYGWRVDGPRSPGHCYDPNIVLLDPAATALSNGARWGMSREPEKHRSTRRSVYFRRPFHWQEDAPLVTPLEDTIIYELHVRGFTCHPSSLAAHPGTFAGLVEKIPYLQSLGVTAVELLPIHEFDETRLPVHQPDHRRSNCATSGATTASPSGPPRRPTPAPATDHGQVIEFREMVRAFHAAGIEVFLDVVFNHTGEGDYRGRTYSFRGLDNQPLLHDRPGRRVFELFRLRQHGQLQSPGRPPAAARTACASGWPTCTWTACASTWRRSWAATTRATCWSSRRWWR